MFALAASTMHEFRSLSVIYEVGKLLPKVIFTKKFPPETVTGPKKGGSVGAYKKLSDRPPIDLLDIYSYQNGKAEYHLAIFIQFITYKDA